VVTGTSNGIACNPLAMEAQNESKAHKMSRVVERYRFKKRSGVPMRNACAYVRLLVAFCSSMCVCAHAVFEWVRNGSKCIKVCSNAGSTRTVRTPKVPWVLRRS